VPLSDEEFRRLVASPESAKVERKASWAESDAIRKTACAFANDLTGTGVPGHILVGVRDDGTLSGESIDDRLLLQLGGIGTDGSMVPPPSIDVEQRDLDGSSVALLTVHPHTLPPVRLRGVTYVRVGPRTTRASAEDERRLAERRRGGDRPFDTIGVSDAMLEDLALATIRETYLPAAVAPEILAENGRTFEQQLLGLRLIDPAAHPTVAALLAFGIDPLRWVPGAYVQFVRFDGTGVTDPIRDQDAIGGPLPTLLRTLDETLKAHVSTALEIGTDIQDTKQADYPYAALQQLVRNAVMHRSYQSGNAPIRVYWFTDRIEITSPGALYGSVNPQNFGTGVTDYRNPLIAETMRNLGFVQRFGAGLPIVRREIERNGNPPVQFQFEDYGVLAVVKGRA
jgi:ATP-dependent DNA helicase RecG